jgi:beta-mannanase
VSTLVIGNAQPPIPAAGRCYTGTHTSNTTTDWANWVTDSSTTKTYQWSTFVPDNGTFALAISQATTIAPSIKALQLAWSFPGSTNLAGTAAGNDDAYITARANELAAYGRPVFLRLNWEMQGDWYTYAAWTSSGTVRTGNTPADFVNAWRRTVGIVRAIAPNAAFVWCPHLWAPVRTSPVYAVTDWYPGDAYVDWCAVTAYPGSSNWDYMRNDTVWGLMAAYGHALAHGKPFMVCEFGIGQGTGDDPVWINQFLDWVEVAAQCKAIAYFSIDNTARNAVDYRLQNWPVSRAVYRSRVTANPRYVSS